MSKKLFLSTLVLIFTLLGRVSFAQDFSNKGREFWFCFPNHIPSGATPGSMSIWITSDQASSGTITMTNGTFSANWTVTANGITSVNIPHNLAHISNAESGAVIQKSLKLLVNTGQPDVVAYAQQYGNARSAATLLLPVNVLGKKYRAFSFTHTGTSGGGQNSRSQFQVIATKPNTQVSVTPYSNGAAGTPFTINLPAVGDMYQYQATSDVTGTLIESIAGASGGCQPIAVFSGNSAVTIGTSNPDCNGNSFDPLFQQMYPVSTWGENYGFIPFGDYNGNPFRVMAAEDNTTVSINGVVVTTLNAGQIYPNTFNSNPSLISTPSSITADKPICVAQYAQTSACSGSNNGDPDMVILNPIEQNIKDITVFTSTQQNINRQWINVLLPTTAVPSFRIDGLVPSTPFQPAPNIPGYSYLRHQFTPAVSGSRFISADSGFNAILYGFQQGNFESYAYSAGSNVKDLNQVLEIGNEYGIETSPNVCTGSPFKFKVYFSNATNAVVPQLIRYDSMRWTCSNNSILIPNNFPVMVYGTPTITPDSINVRNGKDVAWYSLPSNYTINTPGTYSITLTVYRTSNEGCGNSQEYTFPLTVTGPPSATFITDAIQCFAQPVQFTETTPQTPKPTYRFWWDFGDPASGANNNSTVRNPTHTFTGPGTYAVRFANITTPGCISDTVPVNIVIPDLPSASIAGATSVCQNAASPDITFTATNGTAPYTFTYNINGGASQTISTTGTNTSVTLPVPTGVAGTFTYNLTEVKNTNSALCLQAVSQSVVVNVNPLPTASISGNATVCKDATPPTITFTGGAGTAPYTFTYNIDGGGNQTVVSTGSTATVTVPTGTPGTFTYNLVSVQDGSSTLCSQAQTGSVVVTVNPLPTAAIAGSLEVCRNATSPVITFTGASGTAPYTFTYNINGGANQTIASVGNTATISVPTGVAGTFNYNLLGVQEGSSLQCTQVQTGTATVVVNPLPTASIAGNTTVCLNASPPDITFTGASGTAPYTFTYNINGGANQTVVSAGNTATVSVPTGVAGTFNYNLVSVQDATATLCSQAQTGTATVTVNPLPTASIAGTIAVCQNATAPNITFTGAVGTAPYTFTYNINGGSPLTVTTVSGNSVTVTAPTNAVGVFTYNLLSVQEGSSLQCTQVQTGSVTVTVNPLPTASIAGNAEVCRNGTSPVITFTGAVGTAPYTFTYNINGGANQTVVSTGSTATITVPTGTDGTFTYNLISVQDASGTLCSQAQTGSATVVVHPLPTPAFSITTPSCATRNIQFTDNSNPNVGALTNWQWDFGVTPAVTSNLQNPVHVYNTPGTYTVSLTVTNDEGCSNAVPFTQNITINPRPRAGFIVPEVCINDLATVFTDTSSVVGDTFDPTGYHWNFGDPPSGALNTSTTMNGSHLYTAIGPYNVTHVVTTTSGCKDTVTNIIFINAADPVADFNITNVGTLCSNDSVSLVNRSTISQGNVTKLEIYWDVVGAPATFETIDVPVFNGVIKHKYPTLQTAQTYTIRMVAYSGAICFANRTQTITVNAAPRTTFNAVPAVCWDAAPFSLVPFVGDGGVPGTRTFSGPGVSPAGIFNPASVAPGGTYTIKYLHTATIAGCVDSITQTITVFDTASARITYDPVRCEQQSVTFNSNTSTIPTGAGTITGWNWNFGDPGSGANNTSTNATQAHTFNTWGTYNVTLTVTSSNGCRSTVRTEAVRISPKPVPAFDIPPSLCLPSATAVFVNNTTLPDDGSGATVNYLWDFGDPGSGPLNTSTGTSPSHIYNGAGPYTVTLQATSTAGCVATTTRLLNTIHPQPIADFTVNPAEVCIGDAMTFTDNTDYKDGTRVSVNWDLKNGNTRTVPTFSYTYPAAGTYNVELYAINSHGCRSTLHTEPVTVHPYPVVDAGPDRLVLEGGQITLEPVVTGNDLSYVWTPNNSYIVGSNTVKNLVVRGVNDIRYLLTVTARGGCSDTSSVFIKVLKFPSIPNIFSPNGDGVHDRWVIDYLDTYPGSTVEIYNRYGQMIFRSEGYRVPWDGTINGKPVPVGTYYYIVNPKNGRPLMTGYVDVIR